MTVNPVSDRGSEDVLNAGGALRPGIASEDTGPVEPSGVLKRAAQMLHAILQRTREHSTLVPIRMTHHPAPLTAPPRNSIGGPVLRLVFQREAQDCTVACLAMVTGADYDVALEALRRAGGVRRSKSYRLSALERAATLLGRPLRRRRRGAYDPQSAAGIICVRDWANGHTAVLWHGLVFDTDGRVWLVADYLDYWAHGSFCTLLEVSRR